MSWLRRMAGSAPVERKRKGPKRGLSAGRSASSCDERHSRDERIPRGEWAS